MFRFLVSASLRSRLIILLVAAAMVGYGLVIQREIPIDIFPDLNKGLVTVITESNGLAPEEVEALVTTPIEWAMSGADGMTRIRSVSTAGLSIVYVEFDWDIDVYKARQIVAERLDTADDQMPPGIQPVLMPISSYMGEILLTAVVSEEIDPMALREIADWMIAPRLRAIAGVSRVVPLGGLVREYHVIPDLPRMNLLNISVRDVEDAVREFGSNSGGGIVDQTSQEFLIRNIGRTTSLDELRNMAVGVRSGQPILLHQIARVEFVPKQRRGDGGFNGGNAILLSVQKQPGADTLALSSEIDSALEEIAASLPENLEIQDYVFRQADFIEASISNLNKVLIEAIIAVTIILFLFLANVRTTSISLVAIPLSLLTTLIVFNFLGLTINTMTLGGLAIAIGELVDDAVVDVENIYRRLSENRLLEKPRAILTVVADASQEIRSGIVYSTMIIVLVFIPIFSIPGIEGRLFAPLGVAYIVSILASLLVSITVTPVLCSHLLPQIKRLSHQETWAVRKLKRLNEALLNRVIDRPQPIFIAIAIAVVVATLTVPTLPRTFLPAFQEGSLTVSVNLQPGISLNESIKIGKIAEQLILQVPEVVSVGRRTGRSEQDEHALGVHSNEFEVVVAVASRSIEMIKRDVRSRLVSIPAGISVGQPISHRLIDHMLTGAPAQVVIKIFGPDLSTLRNLAFQLEKQLQSVPGLVDINTERQTLIPQIQVKLDPQKAKLFGIQQGALTRQLGHLTNGIQVSQIVDDGRYFDVIVRINQSERDAQRLSNALIMTETGPVPLSMVADIVEASGPNQLLKENGRTRLMVMANADKANDRRVPGDIRKLLDNFELPEGYYFQFEGRYAEQDTSAQRLLLLGLLSLVLIFAVLVTRYRSALLALIIMANVPLALIGSVIALKITGLEISVASAVGFITLTGICTRNGILKISHFINLVIHEGESFGRALIIRGSQERLKPVLMTASSACFGLLPLLFVGDSAGMEMLFPVAVVITGGLLVSTALDAMLTPVLFLFYGEPAVERLVESARQSQGKTISEAF
jgi:HME family heavy-metal exporter